jgi:hypothetical protein
MTETNSQNRTKITVGHFRPDNWLSRWTDAGGGFAAGSGAAHLIRPPCQCATLEALAAEIADPDRKEALAQHLRNGQ